MSRSKRQSRSKSWIQRHQNDAWVKRSNAAGFRSRAVYKLQEIDQRHRLLKPGLRVIDLGAAPGGWSQYAWTKMKQKGVLVAVDLLPMAAIDGVSVFTGDFSSQSFAEFLRQFGEKQGFDLVISDAAPNITGIRDRDEANGLQLLSAIQEFARYWLKAEGRLVLKLFASDGSAFMQRQLRGMYRECRALKPDASRSDSREFYLYCRGLKG